MGKYKSVTVREDIWNILKTLADTLDRSLADTIRIVTEEYMKTHEGAEAN